MSKISTYEVVPIPKLADRLIGTSVGGEIEDLTYNFTLGELLNLFIPNIPANTLQGVLDYGNTATQNINLTGTVNTTNLTVSATATILNSNLTGQTRITGGLFDRLNSIGTAGQVLTSTGTKVEWYTIPTIIPTLQQVLASGNTADINIILTSSLTANTVTAASIVSNTNLSVNGTLRDGNGSTGSIGQVLSSTGTEVEWVNMPVYTATSPLSINSITRVISIQKADSTQDGYLSSADWITFDGKQDGILLTTLGSSGPSTLVGTTINVPNYTLAGLGGVPQTRTLTINGETYNLSADRSWTIAAGVASVSATAPLSSTGGANPVISIQQSDSSLDGYLSSEDWLAFNDKQDYLGGTGLVKSVAGTISYITDNSANWNTAYNDSIVSAAVTGTTTKLLTLNQQDGGTITASWSDIDTGLTSVGVSMPTAFTVTNSPLTSNGTIAITGSGTTLQYIDGTGALQTFPSLTGYVPYTGANQTVNLNTQQLQAGHATFTTNGSTDTLTINHTSGSGRGIIVTKSGNGEGLTVVKGSGSGNAASITGGITLLTTLNLTNALADTYIASSANWNTAYNNRITSLTTTGTSGAATLVSHVLNIPQYQAQGNYITSLTGEATASGPGAASVTLTNSAVTGKVLTGLTVTGSSIASTDSILTAFGKLQGQVNDLIGGLQYQGTWNASTNTPAITSGVGTDGHFYIVSVAGNTTIDGVSGWQVGDWIVFHSPAWQKVDNTESVVSVNGFVGAVTLTTSNISEGTNLYFTNSRARQAISLTTTGNSGASTYDNGTGVLNVPQYTLSGLGGVPTTRALTINGVNFDLSADRTWNVGTVTSIATTGPITGGTITGSGTIGITQAGSASDGFLSSTDWNTFNNKQVAGNYVTTDTTQTITGYKTILRGGDVLNFKIGTDTLYGLKIAYNQNELVPSGEATWSFVNTFNRNGSGFETTPLSFFRGVLVTGERLLSASVNANLLDYYGNNPIGRYPVYAYNTGVQQFSDSILVGYNTGLVNAVTGAIASLPSGVVANFNGRVIGSNAVNSNEFATLGQVLSGYVSSVTASSPLFSSGGVTPNITIQQASGSQNGFLSSTDWNTFNNKAPSVVGGYLPLSGGTLTGPLFGTAASFSGVITTTSTFLASGNLGGNAASWEGNSQYPTLFGSSADRWIMHINPHISYTQNGVNGFTGSMTGATIRFASNPAASSYWDIGVGTNSAGADKLSIGRAGTNFLSITSAGNVGIGTLTAGQKLQIGNGVETGNHYLRIFGAASDIYFGQTGSNLFGAGNGQALVTDSTYTANFAIGTLNSSANLILGAANTPRLTIASTGLSTFSSIVRIEGQYLQIANLSNPSLYLNNTVVQWQNYVKSNNNIAFSDAVRDVLTLGYNGSPSFFQGGNVGIGTNTFAYSPRLAVASVGQNSIAIQTTDTVQGSAGTILYIGTGASTGNSTYGIIRALGNGGTAATNLVIQESGNLLVGTTTDAGFKLDVNGTGRFTPVNTTAYVNTNTLTSGTSLYILNNAVTNNTASTIRLDAVGGDGSLAAASISSVWTASSSSDLTFGTRIGGSNVTERMRITSGGNVGIGTTAPNSISGYNILTINNSTFGGLIDFSNNNTLQGRIGADQGGVYLQAKTNIPMLFFTNDTERMRITSGGNVGIGTNSPDVFGRFYTQTLGLSSSGSTAIQINGGSGGYGQIDFGAAGVRTAGISASANETQWGSVTAIPAIIYTNGSERMRITSGGNVLIGTTTDNGARLQVSGSSTFSGNATIGNLSSGSDAIVNFATNASGGFRSIIYRAATAFMDFTNTAGTSIIQISNGGATTFSSDVTAARYYNPSGPYGTSQANARNHFTQFNAGNATLAGGWIAGAFGDALGNRIVIGQYAGVAVIAGHNGNLDNWASMALATGGGNVMIGTTTDVGAKLYVEGAIRTGAPSGGSAVNWRLGTARGGPVTSNATVRVEIDGVLVDLVARYV
jgi:hypothetical protein